MLLTRGNSISKTQLSKLNSISSLKRLLSKLVLDQEACAPTPLIRNRPKSRKKKKSEFNQRMLGVELTRKRRSRKNLMLKMTQKLFRKLWKTFFSYKTSDPRVSDSKLKVCSKLLSSPRD